VKIERFTSDSATLVTLANVHGNNRDNQKVNFGLQNALNLAYVPLEFKKFSRDSTSGPLKRGREGERRGRARKWKGGKKIEGWVQERKAGEGREGTRGPPFADPRGLGLPSQRAAMTRRESGTNLTCPKPKC
jgi:hypothetical protein